MTGLRRGSVTWLLAHELRLALRGVRAKKVWRYVGLALAVLFAAAAGGAMAFGLYLLQSYAGPAAYAGVTAASLLAFALALFSGVSAATNALYERRDLDLLFSSPLEPRTVLTVRALGIAASSAILLLTVSGAAAIWLIGFGQFRPAAVFLYAIGLAALAGSTALTAALTLFRSIGPRNTRTVVQVAAAIIGGVTFLAFQLPNLMPREERQRFWFDLIEGIATWGPPASSPIWIPARALMGEPLALAAWLGVTLGVFALVVRSFGRRFGDDAAAIASMDRTRRGPSAVPSRFAPGLTSAIMLKEWRLLRRDPALLANLLMQIVYLAPLLIVGFTRLGRGDAESAFFAAGLAGTLTLFAGIIAGLLTWLMISTEDAPDLLDSAPVARAARERAKMASAIVPSLVFVAIPAFGLAIFAPAAAGWALFWSLAATAANAAIYARHQRPMPRTATNMNVKSKAPMLVTLLSGVVNTTWGAAAGFCAGGLWPIALIPAFIGAGLTVAVLDLKTEEEKGVRPKAMKKGRDKRIQPA